MADANVTCPNCSHQFALSQSLQQEVESRARAEFEQAKEKLSKQAEERALALARTKFAEAQADQQQKLALIEEQLAARTQKLAEAQRAQTELMRKTQALEDAKREMDLTIEKRVAENLGTARNQAKQEAEAQLKIKLAEKDETLQGMQRQIEELRRKSEQGSQQTQGEALEVLLEDTLKQAFPRDSVSAVPKGVSGADLIQSVHLDSGAIAGTIVWESKRTKAWSPGWLPKLREDQRAVNGDVSVLISAALPNGVTTFELIDSVWVCSPPFAVSLAHALRAGIVNVAKARGAQIGQESKMELVYNYLTGSQFRNRIEAIVERFTELSEDLDRERKMMTRQWAKREKQLEAVRNATLGMHGDLQGIAGAAIQELDGFEALALDVEDPLP